MIQYDNRYSGGKFEVRIQTSYQPFNPYRQIMEKYPERIITSYIFQYFRFFQQSRSVTVPKVVIYFGPKWHISHHIDICHFKLAS